MGAGLGIKNTRLKALPIRYRLRGYSKPFSKDLAKCYRKCRVITHILNTFKSYFSILFLSVLHSLWDLNSPTGDQTWPLGSGSVELSSHQATREFPKFYL